MKTAQSLNRRYGIAKNRRYSSRPKKRTRMVAMGKRWCPSNSPEPMARRWTEQESSYLQTMFSLNVIHGTLIICILYVSHGTLIICILYVSHGTLIIFILYVSHGTLIICILYVSHGTLIICILYVSHGTLIICILYVSHGTLIICILYIMVYHFHVYLYLM